MYFRQMWNFSGSSSQMTFKPELVAFVPRSSPCLGALAFNCGHLYRPLTLFSVTSFGFNGFNKREITLSNIGCIPERLNHGWRVCVGSSGHDLLPDNESSLSFNVPNTPEGNHRKPPTTPITPIFNNLNRAWPRLENVVSRHVKRRSKVNVMRVICIIMDVECIGGLIITRGYQFCIDVHIWEGTEENYWYYFNRILSMDLNQLVRDLKKPSEGLLFWIILDEHDGARGSSPFRSVWGIMNITWALRERSYDCRRLRLISTCASRLLLSLW